MMRYLIMGLFILSVAGAFYLVTNINWNSAPALREVFVKAAESNSKVNMRDAFKDDWEHVVIFPAGVSKKQIENVIGILWPQYDAYMNFSKPDNLQVILFISQHRVVMAQTVESNIVFKGPGVGKMIPAKQANFTASMEGNKAVITTHSPVEN